jgi:CheY-like chemotaxis protein
LSVARHSSPDSSRILVVDDTADTREMFALYFRSHGFTVETAHDGLDAIEAAHRLHPDVIVMDVAMPGLDGITATREIRRGSDTADIPIVILTAYPILAIKEGALECGASFMMKPCSPEDLEQHIRRVLDARRSGEVGPDARQ